MKTRIALFAAVVAYILASNPASAQETVTETHTEGPVTLSRSLSSDGVLTKSRCISSSNGEMKSSKCVTETSRLTEEEFAVAREDFVHKAGQLEALYELARMAREYEGSIESSTSAMSSRSRANSLSKSESFSNASSSSHSSSRSKQLGGTSVSFRGSALNKAHSIQEAHGIVRH